MTPRLRKLALTVHVISSVGWLGAAAAFLALAVAGLRSRDADLVVAALLMMEPVTRLVLVPLALASLLTGLVQSLGTTWGLFRYYWVVTKLVLTVVAVLILLQYTETIRYIAAAASDTAPSVADLRVLAISPLLHAAGGVLALMLTTILSVYKPRGTTRYGRRAMRNQRRGGGGQSGVPVS